MTHVQEVVDLNPGAVYWKVMTFFTLICCKNCIVCLKRPKINENRGRGWPRKNNNFVLKENIDSFTAMITVPECE